jgi:hypothetical protein
VGSMDEHGALSAAEIVAEALAIADAAMEG